MSNNISCKSLKVRIYPNESQKVILNKTFGCCRFVYNHRVQEHKEWWNVNKNLEKQDRSKPNYLSPKQLRENGYTWLNEDTIAEALMQSLNNCETAYSNWFKSLSGERKGKDIGEPNFKSKRSHHDSFSLFMISNNCFNFNQRLVKIPKLGWTKFNHNKNLKAWFKDAIPKHMTVSKNPAGEYYCSILFEKEEDIYQNVRLNNYTGLDFSPNLLYINDLNENAPDYVAQKQAHKKELQKLQRNLSRKQKGSKNREKARVKLARLEEHIANSRQDYIEKETLRLVQNFGLIGIEDLNIIGLMKAYNKETDENGKTHKKHIAHRNAHNYVDTSWSTFVNKLIWKSQFNDCIVIQSDRFYPSSKTCNHCGYINKDLTLKDRVWICPECRSTIIRDQNAALNLRDNAKKILFESLNQTLGWDSTKVMSMEDIEVNLINNQIYGVSYEVERGINDGPQEDSTF